jgi:hypothetical protein
MPTVKKYRSKVTMHILKIIFLKNQGTLLLLQNSESILSKKLPRGHKLPHQARPLKIEKTIGPSIHITAGMDADGLKRPAIRKINSKRYEYRFNVFEIILISAPITKLTHLEYMQLIVKYAYILKVSPP